MALKGDRYILKSEIAFFMDVTAAEKGQGVVYSGTGSGAALDQSAALVTNSVGTSGIKPAGLLLTDMVNYDLTTRHLNQHKDETQKGGKVSLVTQGWVVTNMVEPNTSPQAGQPAYLMPGGTGYFTNTNAGYNHNVNQPIGRWLSKKDEDGYAKLEINIVNL